jgi:hypothetical protein
LLLLSLFKKETREGEEEVDESDKEELRAELSAF